MWALGGMTKVLIGLRWIDISLAGFQSYVGTGST